MGYYDDDDESSEGPVDPLLKIMEMAGDSDDEEEDSDGPLDPLERIMMMGDDSDEDETDEEPPQESTPRPLHRYPSKGPENPPPPLPTRGRPSISTDEDDDSFSENSDSDGDLDPLSRLAAMEDDSENQEDEDEATANKKILARIIAMRLADVDSNDDDDQDSEDVSNTSRGDPLARLMQMGMDDDDDDDDMEDQTATYGVQEARMQAAEAAREGERLTPEEKELVMRIVEIRIAKLDEEEPEESVYNKNPEDPLETIMNMNAEEQLIANASILAYSTLHEDEDEETEDFYNLNKMIHDDDLEELERQAVAMANSMKTKLEATTLQADLSADTIHQANLENEEDTGMGYLALARGGHKGTVTQAGMMSGSVTPNSVTDDEDGDSSMKSLERKESLASTMTGRSAPTGARVDFTGGVEGIEAPQSPLKWYSSPRKSIPSRWEDPAKEPVDDTKVVVSDWWGVLGDFAGIRSDFSDSQSTMSYTESWVTDSSVVSSTQASLPDVPFSDPWFTNPPVTNDSSHGSKGKGKPLPQQSEYSQNGMHQSPVKSKGVHHSLSLLDQKRRRKREIENWKASIPTNQQTGEIDTWKASISKSFQKGIRR